MSLSLRRLRYFRVIVAEGSFTAAAKRLGIAQPALSQTIRQLEDHFGTPLLNRGRKGVTPTPAGQSVLDVATDVLGRLATLESDLRGHPTEARGDVSIALAVTLSRHITPRLLIKMARRHPKVTVRIVAISSTDAIELMEQRKIDYAVIPIPTPSPRFEARPVYRERVCLTSLSKSVVPDTSPIRFRDLRDIPIVQPSPKYDLRRRLDLAAREVGITLNTRYEQDTSDAMLSIVLAGLAALPTQVSIYHPTMERPLLDIRPIIEPEIMRTHVMLRLANQTPSLAETALETEVIEAIRELAAEAALPGEAIGDGTWSVGSPFSSP